MLLGYFRLMALMAHKLVATAAAAMGHWTNVPVTTVMLTQVTPRAVNNPTMPGKPGVSFGISFLWRWGKC